MSHFTRLVNFIKTWVSDNKGLAVLFVYILFSFAATYIALNGFMELTDSMMEKELASFDKKITGWFQGLESENITVFMEIVTHFGERWPYVVILVVSAIYLYFRTRNIRVVLYATFVLLTATAITYVLKNIFDRERPLGISLADNLSYSYPSGHTMTAMAFYGFLMYLVWHYVPKTVAKISLTIILTFIILLVGSSRIYLGLHYPSDVLAGLAGGFCWAILCIILYRVILYLRSRHSVQ